jgi:hypothetical protein
VKLLGCQMREFYCYYHLNFDTDIALYSCEEKLIDFFIAIVDVVAVKG